MGGEIVKIQETGGNMISEVIMAMASCGVIEEHGSQSSNNNLTVPSLWDLTTL